MVDSWFIFHGQPVSIFYIFFQLRNGCSLAENSRDLSELTNVPPVILPVFKSKGIFHFITSVTDEI